MARTPESERNAIRLELRNLKVYWMPIDRVPKLLKGDYNPANVYKVVRDSRHFQKAWSPGGVTLMVSNCGHVSHLSNPEEAA